MYVGIALIMIFEVLELLVDLILAVWRYYNKGRKADQLADKKTSNDTNQRKIPTFVF